MGTIQNYADNKGYLSLIISDGQYIYGKLGLDVSKLQYWPLRGCYTIVEVIDCTFLHYFLKELVNSVIYRMLYTKNLQKRNKNFTEIHFLLEPTKVDLIDYKWNFRVSQMVREHCELDHGLSWLSTLGGAFSALGDYYSNCAETAGKISFHQMRLALRLRDPLIASRCKLYFALSLIQQLRFKKAKQIIYYEYVTACNAPIKDIRLTRMCKGIWSKLQHEHSLYVNKQYQEKIINKSVKF